MSKSEGVRKAPSNVLSAEELVRQGWQQDSSLPIRGVKDYAPDGSWIQDKRLEVTLRDRASLLEEQRVAKLGSLARGEWKPDVKKVHLVKNKKKFWQTMGHSEDGIDYLHPEEALFLLDAGMMEVYYGGLPLSLQQAFSCLLGPHLTVEQYQVFAFLSRYGYILRRHNPDLFLTDYERQLKIDQYSKIAPKKKKNRKRAAQATATKSELDRLTDENIPSKRVKEDGEEIDRDVEPTSSMTSICLTSSKGVNKAGNEDNFSRRNGVQCQSVEPVYSDAERKVPVISKGEKEGDLSEGTGVLCQSLDSSSSPSNKTATPTQNVRSGGNSDHIDVPQESRVTEGTSQSVKSTDFKPTSSIPYTRWNWNEVALPNMANKSSLVVRKPNMDLLPCCVLFDKDSYTFDLDVFKRQRRPEKNWEFSLGGTSWKRNIQARDWGEYRREYQAHQTDYGLETSPAGHLWTGDVVPLVRPQDARNMKTILQKLQIIESVQLTLPKYTLDAESQHPKQNLHILFDVYLPNSKFKKTLETLPHHHLCIVKCSDRLPSRGETIRLARSCRTQVPLHFAVVDEGDMNFYIFHDIQLPTDT